MKFSTWLEAKKAQPVQMPKEESDKIKIKEPKQRIAGGRRDTSFDSRPKRQRTRADINRKALEE